MTTFLRLTNRIININSIEQIIISKKTVDIYFNSSLIEGGFLFSSGTIDTHKRLLSFCKKDDKTDYEIIRKFMYPYENYNYDYDNENINNRQPKYPDI